MAIDTGASAVQSRPGILETIGLVLALAALALCALALGSAIFGMLQHTTAAATTFTTYGISTARKTAAVVGLALLGLIAPAAACFLYFDWLGTGLSTRMRLSLVGWLVTPLAAIAVVSIVNFPNGW